MRKTSNWKLGDRYAYITSLGKRGIVDKLSQVPAGAKSGSRAPPKKKGPKKTSPSKKRSKKTVTKKKTKKSGGFKLPGGIGPKGVLFGALGLTLVPTLVPVPPQAAKLVTGLAMRALKIGGGGPLAAVGMMELVAAYAAPLLGGMLPNGAPGSVRGYDY